MYFCAWEEGRQRQIQENTSPSTSLLLLSPFIAVHRRSLYFYVPFKRSPRFFFFVCYKSFWGLNLPGLPGIPPNNGYHNTHISQHCHGGKLFPCLFTSSLTFYKERQSTCSFCACCLGRVALRIVRPHGVTRKVSKFLLPFALACVCKLYRRKKG